MTPLTRRGTLLGGSATVLTFGPALAEPTVRGPTSTGLPDLVARITFPRGVPVNGAVTFDIAAGKDIGSYTAPTARYTQRCIRVHNPALPNFFVDFRPDTSGGRVEVVFWNGEVDPVNARVPSGHTRNLPSYTATISNGESAIYTATIPYHYWGTRWRYQSAVRPVIRKSGQVLGNFFPNMSLVAARLKGNNLSTGKPWSGKPYSDGVGRVIQPALLRNGAKNFTSTYTPFMRPDPESISDSPMPSTTLASNAASGMSAVTVANSSRFSAADHVTIELANGTYFTARIRTVTGATWTLESALPDAANSGAKVYNGEYKLGLYLYIETGGERAELGVMTEWAADYLLNGTANSLHALRQHAEMASSEWPFFLPDLNTGCALNFKQDLKRYKTYIDSVAYGPYYQAAFINQSNGWDFHEGDTHFQMHPYIAHALTEDAYFLEGVQFIQAYGIGHRGAMLGREGNPARGHGQYGWGDLLGTPSGAAGTNGAFTNCSYYGEIRSVGNGIRNLAMAYKVSPAKPPSWLLPQSYFAALSSDYSSAINTLWTKSKANLHAVFRQLGEDNYFQAFEQAYGLMGMAIADLVGMPTRSSPSWLAHLTFYFGMFEAITNGTSGWNNQTPQPHDIQNNAAVEKPTSGVLNFQNYASWSALYGAVAAFMKSGATFASAPSPGNQQGGSMGNCNMLYAACAMAKSRGVPAAASAKAWFDQFIDFNYPNSSDRSMGISFEMKCGFDGT